MSSATATTIQRVEDLSGAQRAAVLLMYLDDAAARSLMQHLSEGELHGIGVAIAEVDSVAPEAVESVVADFIRDMHGASMMSHTGREYALDVLPGLVDEPRRRTVERSIRRLVSTAFEEYIRSRPARTVATILLDEHPQVQAVALLLMGPDNAAEVLACFDEQDQFEVSLRMADFDTIPGDLADDVESALRAALEDQGSGRWQVKGVEQTAQTLGRLGRERQEPLIERISERDAELSETLRRRMVVFSDLRTLDQRAVQAILKAIDRQTLLLGLRGADATMREVFFGNMGKRAGQDLREELEYMRPVPRSQLETAQERIVQAALDLQEDGVIELYGASEDLV